MAAGLDRNKFVFNQQMQSKQMKEPGTSDYQIEFFFYTSIFILLYWLFLNSFIIL